MEEEGGQGMRMGSDSAGRAALPLPRALASLPAALTRLISSVISLASVLISRGSKIISQGVGAIEVISELRIANQ